MGNKFYPTIKNSILLCLLVMGIQIFLGMIIGILKLKFVFFIDSSVMGIITIITGIYSFGVASIIGFKETKRKFNEVFKFNRVSVFLWIATIVFITGFTVVISETDNVLNYFLPPPEKLRYLFDTLMTGQPLILSIIAVGIIPAFTEELFFRGLVLDGFQKNYSKRKAIIISALLFGIIHLNPWQFYSGFIFGLIAAWICIETNSILLCIFIHFFNNTLYTIVVKYREFIPIKGFNTNFSALAEFQPLWFDLTGLVIFIIGTIMLIKGVEKTKTKPDGLIV
jgi:membrane protease YdiL (CAAX protease family)